MQYAKLNFRGCDIMVNKKATVRITPCGRPCLSVAFTFMGRSSALPTILKHYKGTKYIRVMQHKSTFGHILST